MMIAGMTMAALSLSGMIAGCQRNVPPSMEKVNNAPLANDDAINKRDWEKTTSYYGNGDTIAGGTGYMFQTHETVTDPYRRIVDPTISSMNMVLLPIGVFVNSPFQPQVVQGEMIPPSYTAQPPLP
jgi:hypothetical protein